MRLGRNLLWSNDGRGLGASLAWSDDTLLVLDRQGAIHELDTGHAAVELRGHPAELGPVTHDVAIGVPPQRGITAQHVIFLELVALVLRKLLLLDNIEAERDFESKRQ